MIKKIFFGTGDTGGCYWYRAYIPSLALKEAGYEVEIRDAFRPLIDLDNFDLFIFQREGNPVLLDLLKKSNKHYIADFDDLFFHVPGTSMAFIAYKESEVQKNFINFHRNADLITVSTERLKEEFQKRIKKDVMVVENHWCEPLFHPTLAAEETRIGWFGSTSHTSDLRLIFGALEILWRKYKSKHKDNIKFIFVSNPKWLKQLLPSTIPNEAIEIYSYVDVHEFIDFLHSLNIHIGLAPLEDNLFNACKSPIKFFEYTQIGALTIASDVEPYKSVIKHEKTGFLVKKNKTKNWVKCIEQAIEDGLKRIEIVKSAQLDIMNWHYSKLIPKWKRILALFEKSK